MNTDNSVNLVFISGLLREPAKVGTTKQSGLTYAFGFIDVSRRRKDQYEVYSIGIKCFGNEAEALARIPGGSIVFCEGELQTRKYTNQMGNNVVATEVLVRAFLNRGRDDNCREETLQ